MRLKSPAAIGAAFLLIFFSPIPGVLSPSNAAEKKITLMTWNIRGDGSPFGLDDGRHTWKDRKPLLKQRVDLHAPDLIGIQEGYEDQQKDLADFLTGFQLSAVHRRRWHKSYYSSILYRPDRMTVLETYDAWLSKTPEIQGSQLPGSIYPRMVTGLKILFKPCSCQLWIFNTHLEHKNMSLNSKQMNILTRLVKDKVSNAGIPVVLMGDFNRPPTGPDYLELRSALKAEDPWRLLGLLEQSTFNDYGKYDFTNDTSQRIDWMIAMDELKPQQVKLDTFRLNPEGKEPTFPSDHFPVIVDFTIK